ncbi:MAG: type II toxin-antitoxin system HicB family antitoxin [Oscillospiraceae bacterium]|jgi:predicted RNase H-like HicB family nuclease|nr:type II toxin-antitoxin system HicB family antitoxin [Oscillospiraceae bacterium]
MTAKLSMICSKQDNGSYFAVCPEVKGCYTQGDTYEEAFANLKELVEITVKEDLTEEERQNIVQSASKIFSEFEIAV